MMTYVVFCATFACCSSGNGSHTTNFFQVLASHCLVRVSADDAKHAQQYLAAPNPYLRLFDLMP